ncbi:efflux RND transporter permease subunit, partial [Luoshenia tenuis]
SLLSPFIVMFTMPLAFTGGLLALWMCGMEISMISMLGFLVLAGIVVNNGIVFIDYVNQLRASGMERRDALVRAGQTRLRPILMTALTTILGLTTMAMGIGMGAEMIQPMAVVTIGGLSYATLLTLFVVPALYDIMQRRPVKNVQLEGEQVDQAL